MDREWTLEGNAKKKKAVENVDLKVCPECYATFSPVDKNGVKRDRCPECGYIFPKSEEDQGEKSRALSEEKDIELTKITGFVLDYKTPEECHSYGELVEYARSHGYKPGWAYYQARRRGLLTL
jgi:Zn-finger nucleic acid-binding protein